MPLAQITRFISMTRRKAIGADGVAQRLTVPAMQRAPSSARELVARAETSGGMKIRMPHGAEPMHASDLFSSAFLRWQTESSFDNVHANPDPLQWQSADSFYYSMPFPPLGEYDCTLALFNPYGVRSTGAITLRDRGGAKVVSKRYELNGYSSLLLCLNTANFGCDPRDVLIKSGAKRTAQPEKQPLDAGGMLAVTNDPGSMKASAISSSGSLIAGALVLSTPFIKMFLFQGLRRLRLTRVAISKRKTFSIPRSCLMANGLVESHSNRASFSARVCPSSRSSGSIHLLPDQTALFSGKERLTPGCQICYLPLNFIRA